MAAERVDQRQGYSFGLAALSPGTVLPSPRWLMQTLRSAGALEVAPGSFARLAYAPTGKRLPQECLMPVRQSGNRQKNVAWSLISAAGR